MNELMAAAAGLATGIAIMMLVCMKRKPDVEKDGDRFQWIESREVAIYYNENYGWAVMEDGRMVTHSCDFRKAIDQAKRLLP